MPLIVSTATNLFWMEPSKRYDADDKRQVTLLQHVCCCGHIIHSRAKESWRAVALVFNNIAACDKRWHTASLVCLEQSCMCALVVLHHLDLKMPSIVIIRNQYTIITESNLLLLITDLNRCNKGKIQILI